MSDRVTDPVSDPAGDGRPVLVGGASGFVGRRLVDHLVAHGVAVRCGSRDPERARRAAPHLDWVRYDVDDPASLRAALRGARALVHLVHHLADPEADLVGREAAAAERVRDAVDAEGVPRVVFLGAPATGADASDHLLARRRTGEVLRSGRASAIELRASMIVGAGSESFLIVRDLALRLPAMVLPSWLRSRSQPLAIEDAVRALAAAVELPPDVAGAYDLPGPEVLSAREILQRIAALVGMRPVMVAVPFPTPTLSSWWIRLVTRADATVARRLVHGLTTDHVVRGGGFWAVIGDRPRVGFDEAVRRALAEERAPRSTVGRTWERVARRVARRARPR
jgi:uncharacterized protein YbjT (DUF2867 family)